MESGPTNLLWIDLTICNLEGKNGFYRKQAKQMEAMAIVVDADRLEHMD